MGNKKRNLIIKKAMAMFIALALMAWNGGSVAAAGVVDEETTVCFETKSSTEGLSVASSSGYDSNAAIKYAHANYGAPELDGNPMECAEFAASCLKAGGIGINPKSNTFVYQLRNWLRNSSDFKECRLNYDKNALYADGKVSVGDVIIYCGPKGENDSRPPHAAFITRIDGNEVKITDRNNYNSEGKPEWDSRTCDRKAVYYNGGSHSCKEGTTTIYGFHYTGGGGGNTPTGHIDSASGGEGKIYVGGWALDPDSPSTPVQVNLYIAGISNPIASFNTHDYRDIAGGVNCGFEEIIDVSGKGLAGWRDISLWAIDVTGDENAGIGDARIEILPDPDEEVPHNDCEMQEGIDKIKDGNYVFASAYSLDDETNKLNDNPYVMETDENDVVVTKGLSADSTVWVVEYAQYKRFYSIRSPKKAKGNMQLESEDNNRKTNIKVGRWKGEDCTCYWVFDEKNGMYRVKNMHSGMCATKSDGNSVKQLDWKGGNTDTQLWLLIEPDRPTINTSSIPDGTTGKAYNTSLSGKCDEWVAIKWSASNLPAGLSMSPDGVISGIPTEAGDYNVKVDATNFFGTTSKTYNIVIESTYVPVTGVTLPENETVEVGSSITLTPDIIPSNATDKTRTWVSSEPAVATVNENGVVTGVKEGQTEITVTTNSKDGSHSAKCTVTVSPKPIPFVPGDVTMDGYVYMDDVLMLSRAVAGTYTLTEEQEKRGDVTGDQKIGMNDVVKVARFVAGTLDSL